MTGDVRWVPAAALADLWEGDILGVDLKGRQILLVRPFDGPVKAYQGDCPHLGAPLADGDWDPEQNILVCLGHHWEFDLASGCGLNPADCRLKEYPVRLVGDSVHVGFQHSGGQHEDRAPTELRMTP